MLLLTKVSISFASLFVLASNHLSAFAVVSDQCDTEVSAIYSDGSFNDAVSAVAASATSCDTTGTLCITDFSESIAAITDLCRTAAGGGYLYTGDYHIGCSSIELFAASYPLCTGPSCSQADTEEVFAAAFLIEILTLEGLGYYCTTGLDGFTNISGGASVSVPTQPPVAVIAAPVSSEQAPTNAPPATVPMPMSSTNAPTKTAATGTTPMETPTTTSSTSAGAESPVSAPSAPPVLVRSKTTSGTAGRVGTLFSVCFTVVAASSFASNIIMMMLQ